MYNCRGLYLPLAYKVNIFSEYMKAVFIYSSTEKDIVWQTTMHQKQLDLL